MLASRETPLHGWRTDPIVPTARVSSPLSAPSPMEVKGGLFVGIEDTPAGGRAVMAWTRTRLEVPAITGDPSILLAVPPPDGGWIPRLGQTVTLDRPRGTHGKGVSPSVLLEKLDRSLDQDLDRALFGLPPRSPTGVHSRCMVWGLAWPARGCRSLPAKTKS